MASGTTASAAPKGKRKSSSRRRLVRRLIGLGIPLTVAAVAVVLAVYTQITLTFEGRVWTLPSRIYSARLHVVPGMALDRDALAARLERSGGARS